MPLHLIERDITKMQVDAIVNSTNRKMIGYSGIDKLIHELGGEAFEEECRALAGKCCPGEAVYTKAYNLDCKYIIHTVSPWWEDGVKGEAAILRSCYRKSLELAEELNCKSLAFPLIASGQMGYPITEALKNAIETVRDYLALYTDMDVYLCLFGTAALRIAKQTYGDLDDLILGKAKESACCMSATAIPDNLDTLVKNPGKNFADSLFELFAAKKIENCVPYYKAAGMSRSSFSRLNSGETKAPKKDIVIGFCMAMKLSIEEAEKLMASAGYVLGQNNTEDIIARYFLEHKRYDIYELNTQLLHYGCEKHLVGNVEGEN